MGGESVKQSEEMLENSFYKNEKIENDEWSPVLFANRLKTLIGEGSVSKFAKKCGIAESMLRKYLLGESVPGGDKLVRVARVANVSLQWLATGTGNQSDAAGWDRVSPFQLAIVLEFEHYARRRPDGSTRSAIRAFVQDYNQGLLEVGTIGDIPQITEEELILWRDIAWERKVEKAMIDEAGLCTAIEIADELTNDFGKTMDARKKAKLIVAIHRLNATTDRGIDRSMLMNLLISIS